MPKRHTTICTLGLLLGISLSVAAQSASPLPRVQVTPDQLQWTRNPNGIEQVVIVGDPTKAGIYTMRLNFPKGLKVQPHMHPDPRVAVVLSGTMYFAFGESFDEAALKAMPTGSTWTEVPNSAHFAYAKDGDVVVQVVGLGPTASTPVVK